MTFSMLGDVFAVLVACVTRSIRTSKTHASRVLSWKLRIQLGQRRLLAFEPAQASLTAFAADFSLHEQVRHKELPEKYVRNRAKRASLCLFPDRFECINDHRDKEIEEPEIQDDNAANEEKARGEIFRIHGQVHDWSPCIY